MLLWLLDYGNRDTLKSVTLTKCTIVQLMQHLYFLMATNSVFLFQLLHIYIQSLSVSTSTLTYGSEFFITSVEFPFHCYQKLNSIYMCSQSLLYNTKSQIHQPPCQVSSMGNRAFTCYAHKFWNSLNRNSSLNPLSFIISFLRFTY